MAGCISGIGSSGTGSSGSVCGNICTAVSRCCVCQPCRAIGSYGALVDHLTLTCIHDAVHRSNSSIWALAHQVKARAGQLVLLLQLLL
jgi:hypothetical protein